ncbi:hypothetical protein [Aneurinibacillus sp. REN35]|uniref:hypothetical protein n=2 Tax=Aneurinibacillus sp. REN35 TaxID=3237286 RepID=UPI00356B77AA
MRNTFSYSEVIVMKKFFAFALAACVVGSSVSAFAATEHHEKKMHTKSTHHAKHHGKMHIKETKPHMPKTGAGGASEVE